MEGRKSPMTLMENYNKARESLLKHVGLTSDSEIMIHDFTMHFWKIRSGIGVLYAIERHNLGKFWEDGDGDLMDFYRKNAIYRGKEFTMVWVEENFLAVFRNGKELHDE